MTSLKDKLIIFCLCASFVNACSSADNLCLTGVKSESHIPELHAELLKSLTDRDIDYVEFTDTTICYSAKDRELVTNLILELSNRTHPVGRLEIARGFDDQIFSLLGESDIPYQSHIENNMLIIIFDKGYENEGNRIVEEFLQQHLGSE